MAEFQIEIHTPYTAEPQQFALPGSALPGFKETWERTENEWGFFQGHAVIHEGDGVDFAKLLRWHAQLLGYEVREVMGTAVFEGYINEMRLYREGDDVVRVRGYDVGGRGDEPPGMFNAVRVALGNLVENPEFEVRDPGATFLSWSENLSGGMVTTETTNPVRHEVSLKVTNASGSGTYAYQNITVEPNTPYKFSFVTCGDGTVAGQYTVRDVTHATDLYAASTGATALGQFETISEEFVTPAGCTTLQIRFRAPSTAGYALFDTVRLQRVVDGGNGESYTDWATQDESIARHGRREITLDGRERSGAQAILYRDTFLARRAWPLEVQRGGSGATRLELYVNGYIHRAEWLETDETTDGVIGAASDLIKTLVAMLPFVKLAVVDENTETHTFAERRQSVLSALREVMDGGDADAALWRIYMDAGRTLLYRKVSFHPQYVMTGGVIYPQLGARNRVDPRLLRAMRVIRNYDFPDSSVLPGALLLQRNDSLLESVTVGPDGLRREVLEL